MNVARTDVPSGVSPSGRFLILGPILAGGFGTAIVVWIAWYITHLNWVVTSLQLSEAAPVPLLLVLWLLAMILVGTQVPRRRGWLVGAGAGVIAAAGLLIGLGTKTEAATPGFENLKPANLLIAAGFLGMGGVLGLVGGTIGSLFARPKPRADWLFRFAVIAAAAVAPLLFIGGLVTSTNSGMAVPDWPNTFGSNILLYPLGQHGDPKIFLEHSHRLYAAFVGITTLTLAIFTTAAEQRRWLKILAVVAFLLVAAQGGLGGLRVLMGSPDPQRDRVIGRVFAMLHGILAQLTFALICSIAVYLAPTFKAAPALLAPGETVPGGRPLKFFSTGLVHSATLQLLFGAAYRHFRDSHSLWAHVAFSIVVLLFGLLSGFAATALKGEYGGLGRIIRRAGTIVLTVVCIQFTLGWITFALGGKNVQADTAPQALLRTAHQANGGLLLGMALVQFLWARRLMKLTRPRIEAP